MELILNLSGAVQEVKTSRTNKEKVESVYRLVEEFYKTSAILLYSRYLAQVKEKDTDVTEEMQSLINQYIDEPTFDSWMKLEKLCLDNLPIDRFAEAYKRAISADIEEIWPSNLKIS